MKIIKLSEKGQIAIPQIIRDKIGLNKGDELVLLESNGRILLEKVKNVHSLIKDNFEDIVDFSENSLKEVWDNKEDAVWEEYLKK